MMRSTLGASLGGTTRGGHQGVESLAVSLITPPNLGAGAGSCLPSTVVVASAEPNWPVTCCATAGATARMATTRNAAIAATILVSLGFMLFRLSLHKPRHYPAPRPDKASLSRHKSSV